MNELSQLCDTFGADIEKVRGGVGSDSRIGSAFLFPGVGYGGSCFPKDVRALIHMGQKQDCPMSIADAVESSNIKQQDYFANRVIEHFKGKEDVTLGVWGLAFKAKTDDTRKSPAIRCTGKFVEAGIKVKAYDPEAGPDKLEGKIDICKQSYDVLDGADALVIFTDWQEFRNPDFEQIVARLNKPVIFDGRNLYDPGYVKKQGIEYYSIGRP